MENYLYVNIFVSCLALLLIKYGKGTSLAHYYVSLIAIIVWLIPYPMLANLIPEQVLTEPMILAFSQASSISPAVTEPLPHINSSGWLQWLLPLLLSIGVALFALRFSQAVRWNAKTKEDSSLTFLKELSLKHQVPVYASENISGGLLLGIVNPMIIISKHIQDAKHVELIIAHEKQHQRSKDNLRLLFLEAVQCLFWWNPLVNKLVQLNRFFIEARCDENTSHDYGAEQYVEDLSSLILSNHYQSESRMVCSAISINKTNVARIKLLKEKRTMTLKKKLGYLVIACITLMAMSWHTLVNATISENGSSGGSGQNRLVALVNFDVSVTDRVNHGEIENTTHAEIKMLVDFNKEASFQVNEHFLFKFKVSDEDKEKLASFEMEIVEITEGEEKVVSRPKLKSAFGQEAMVEIDNPDTSLNAYSIKFNLAKVPFSG